MAELLTKEQLQELTNLCQQAIRLKDGRMDEARSNALLQFGTKFADPVLCLALLDHIRALEAERETLIADLNETRRLAFNRGQAVEAFRVRAIKAIWKDVEIYGPIDLDRTVETLQSLSAISSQEEQSSGR